MNNNDYELIYMYRIGEAQAFDILYKKYYAAIKKCTLETIKLCPRLDFDDVFQELSLVFVTAIDNYTEDKGNFFTYMYQCLNFQVKRFYSEYYNPNKTIIYRTISIDDLNEDGLNGIPQSVLIDNSYLSNPINTVIIKEESDFYLKSSKTMSKNEAMCYSCMLKGDDVKEIALKMNTSIKQIYNSIGRIKSKLKIK